MMICGNQYFLDLTEKKLDTIIDDLRKRWQERGGGPAGGSPTRTLFGVGPAPGGKA
jgi:hypothetical protein